MQVSGWYEDEASRKSGYRLHVISHDEHWSYPLHRHEGCCEIVVMLHGEVRHELAGGNALEQEAGQVLLLREGDSHALSGGNFTYVNIMFAASWLTRLESYTQLHGLVAQLSAGAISPSALVPEPERQPYYELVDELRHNYSRESGRQVFANFLSQTVTRYLAPVVSIDIPAGTPDWLAETVVWLQGHHDLLPSLGELLDHTCRCKEHVTRQFTQWLGLSPARYLARMRVDRAAELLSTTNYPVQEVCDQVGFNNESYFYRLFTRSKGMTPRAWRRAHGQRSIQA